MGQQREFVFSKRRLYFSFSAIALLMIFSGYFYFRYEVESVREEKYHDLRVISGLKIDQILQWRKERYAEAIFFSSNENFIRHAVTLASRKDTLAANTYFTSRLGTTGRSHTYENIFVVQGNHRVLFSLNPDQILLHSQTRAFIDSAHSADTIYFSDFYFCPSHDNIHLDIVAPLKDKSYGGQLAVVFRVDPSTYLFPLIQAWPTSSKTSETLILRQDGDSVLFLNNLRHWDNPAMNTRISMDELEVPAVQALLGYEGIFEGVDYRGTEVLSSVQKVPGTPWYMIAKVDKREIFSEMYFIGMAILLFILMMILFTGATLIWYYHYQQRNIFRRLFRKEKELWESQESFRTTLYSIGDAVITTDVEGRVQRMNPVAENLTGWKEAEAAGHSLSEVFHIINEYSRQPVENPVSRVLESGKVVGLANHTLLIRRQGDEIPIADSGAPIRDESGEVQGVVLVFRDQTYERMVRRRIEDNEAKLIKAQKIAQLGSWEFLPNRHKATWSDEMFVLTGFNPESGVPSLKDFMNRVRDEDREILQKALNPSEDNAQDVIMDLRFFHPENGVRYLIIRIERESGPDKDEQKLSGTLQDITELRHAESEREKALKALKESEAKYRNLFNNAQVGIFRTTLVDGLPLEINRTYAQLAGYDTVEDCKADFMAADSYVDPAVRNRLISILLHQGEVNNFEAELIRRDGTHFWIIFSARLNRDKEYIEGALVDITQRKHTETELMAAKEHAEESDRLKSAFLANLNHEIRTPMNAIVGFTDLLNEELPAETMSKYIATINLNADHLLKIIDDVLAMSRLESEKIPLDVQPFELRELFDGLYANFSQRKSKDSVQISCTVPAELEELKIEADRDKIHQVMSGLLSNAIKYTAEGTIEFGCTTQGPKLIFYVKDTGMGITQKELPFIFNRFYRGERAQQSIIRGTGLGLSIARSLVSLLGGEIWVESEPEQGSVFYFSIRLTHAGNIATAPKLFEPSGGLLNEVNVLIAEDEITNYQYLEELLKPVVNQIGYATNGQEAVSLMENQNFNLVLMDIKMPVMDGLEATRLIKQKFPLVPVIAQSAYTQPEEKHKAFEAGCDAYLSKPIRKAELLKQIKAFFPKRN